MTILGALTVNAVLTPVLPAVTFNFNTLEFTEGFPQVDLPDIIEPVTSRGVNFLRLRIVRKEYPSFVLTCRSAHVTFAAAVTAARSMRQMPGRNAGLSVTMDATLYDFSTRKFYILAVKSVPVPTDSIVQAGLALGQQGMVLSTWTLQDSGA